MTGAVTAAVTEVAIDVSAVPDQPAGAGRYVFELVRHLAARSEIDLITISRKADSARWTALAGRLSNRAMAPASRPLRLAWEQVKLPGAVARIAPDVFHSPHYTMPERAHTPVVVTIHDMTLFDHPEWHEKAKVKFFQRAITVATKKADALIAVSNDTARRLQARFGELNVHVIPHGVDHDRFNPIAGASDVALLRQFGIPQRYIAFVGTLEPRKDVPTLLRAFDRLAGQLPDTYLVLAGGAGWGNKEFLATLRSMKFKSRVLQTGFIPDALIPPLLRNAKAVAYPSLAEGFGLPALEALACGTTLITTTGSAMEEIVGDAALLVPPGDEIVLSDALDRALTDEVESARLHAAGPRVAAKFTWDACAAAHEAVYAETAKR